MSVTVLEDDIKTYPENLHNEEVSYEAAPSELEKLIKEVIVYLEGIEKDNKEIEEYIKKLQKEYDVQNQQNKKKKFLHKSLTKNLNLVYKREVY